TARHLLPQGGRRRGIARERARALDAGSAGAPLPRGHLRGCEALQRTLPAAALQPGVRAALHGARRPRGARRGGGSGGDLPAGRASGRRREGTRHAVPAHHALLPAAWTPRPPAAADEMVHPLRQARPGSCDERGGRLPACAPRGDARAAALAGNGDPPEEPPAIGVLRMIPNLSGGPPTYL